MKKKVIFLSLAIIVGICLTIFGYYAMQNENDPDWDYVDNLLKNKKIQTLDKKIDVLDSLFQSIQKDTILHKTSAIELINKPKLPIYEYRSFMDVVSIVYKSKYILISGTHSTGRSTLSNMISIIIAADSSRILFLQCVPKLEVEYHKEYIGYNTETGYKKGKLLKFWEQCRTDSMHNYLFLIDDIDKIQPATLFGAPIWAKFKDNEYKHPIEGYTKDIVIPKNFWMISVAAFGQNSELKFTEEHYSRISPNGVYNYFADPVMFYLLIRKKFDTSTQKDFQRLKNLVYFYIKANQYIEKKYGTAFLVGQKSSIKNYLGENQWEEFINSFVTQVNAMEPMPRATKEDFDEIVYSIENNGKLKNTNLFGKIYVYLVVELGILKEIIITLIIMLGGVIFGYIYSDKRKHFHQLIEKSNAAFVDFEAGKITKEKFNLELMMVRKEFDRLMEKGQIKQSEATFFLGFMHDKLAHRTLVGDFFDLLNSCLSDNKISEEEHKELLDLLEKIKDDVAENQYESIKAKLSDLKGL